MSERPYLSIDAPRLAHAMRYYEHEGYIDTPTPWLVGEEAYMATVPPGHDNYLWRSLTGDYHVASAEQGFMQLMVDGVEIPEKAQSTSPCYRGEQEYDKYHLPYFYKLELYNEDTSDISLANMIICARGLFTSVNIATRVVRTGERAYDTETVDTHLELGSYGYRKFRDHEWLYGTGLALPRASQT